MVREIKLVRELTRELYDEMHKAGGFRERAVLEMYRDGVAKIVTRQNGSWLEFNYPTEIEYQDANGATFDLISERWIG